MTAQDAACSSLDDELAALAPLGDLFAGLPAAASRRPVLARPAARQERAGDWRHRARCTDADALDEAGVRLEWFTSDVRDEREAAVLVCYRCPVVTDCRQAVIEQTDWRSTAHGVWGGEDVTGLRGASLRKRGKRAAEAGER